ncbi:4Fe-4S binding protein [cf. Phormidesmis sp. LEGE 11477]|uniref:4Fe-4S binding protein n=1 Tax=cf. Phormidesmis sp. LEGE 11477 TaxID=1828680 RepID=UPI00187E3477|nr:4Fe-4S binding protein [cf. Phormidesmis sp. LEGE 11477]MBE9062256.1 4Fe-4S binding protein [cf. Phormidesmis sp. LEGE 11477]
MTYAITEDCIGCQRCLPACPTNAIEPNGDSFSINTDLCNNCQGFHSVPQCWSVCPTNSGCVSLSPESTAFTFSRALETSTDYWQAWQANYDYRISKLRDSAQSGYWHDWFDTYSQTLQKLQAHPKKTENVPLVP